MDKMDNFELLEMVGTLKHNMSFDDFKLKYFGEGYVPLHTVSDFYEDFICCGKDFDSYVKETTSEY